jgi:hypothetical protein
MFLLLGRELHSRLDAGTLVLHTMNGDSLTQTQYHNESVLKKYAPKLKIGTVKEESKL